MGRSTSTLERVCGLSRQGGSRTSAFCVRGVLSAYQSYLFVALQANEVVGFIRFAVQPIGPEAKCPALYLNGVQLTEAKIHAFAVREDARGQGIGTELQRQTIRRAKDLGCYQVASYSSYGRDVTITSNSLWALRHSQKFMETMIKASISSCHSKTPHRNSSTGLLDRARCRAGCTH